MLALGLPMVTLAVAAALQCALAVGAMLVMVSKAVALAEAPTAEASTAGALATTVTVDPMDSVRGLFTTMAMIAATSSRRSAGFGPATKNARGKSL